MFLLQLYQLDQLVQWMKRRPCKLRDPCSNLIETRTFLFFCNFIFFKLAVSFLRDLARSTNFHILIYMSIRSYYINKKLVRTWALFLILLSKSHIFSPKNLHFFSVKLFWCLLATFNLWHIDHKVTVVLESCQIKKSGFEILMRSWGGLSKSALLRGSTIVDTSFEM